MSVRSLNKVILIGNLTRDPELRYTGKGTAVCSFGVATNRGWTTDSGERKEETEFHRIVAWNKLAEICSQLLSKGRKVFVEGRLRTRDWEGQDGNKRTTTEIVIDDMIVLDSKYKSNDNYSASDTGPSAPAAASAPQIPEVQVEQPVASEPTTQEPAVEKSPKNENVNPDDIPF